MSDRIYHPPLINGDCSPDAVVSQQSGADFSLLRQRRYTRNGESFFGCGPGIAIFTDGCCLNNGRPAIARAGMGVFFGPNSEYNMSEPLRSWPKTNQRAEICAVTLALNKVYSLLRSGDLETTHLAIITDSAYVVNAMTDWVPNKWLSNGWTSSKGERVVNADDFSELDGIVNVLEDMDVAVRFWRVDRDENEDADELARDAAYSA